MKVTVAIPSYNGLTFLQKILPSLRGQGFDQIYVLDDASTDDSLKWLKTQADVQVIEGKQNVGPTANRNRILPVVKDDIILFLDADVQIIGSDIAAKISRHFSDYSNLAVAGTLVLSEQDAPMWFNWGYDTTPCRDFVTEVLNRKALANWNKPRVMKWVRRLARGRVGHFEPVQDREVDWVVEMFFAVRADVFQKLSGFDEGFQRFHEGPDYCKRVRSAGYSVRFFTDIQVKHLDMHTGSEAERRKAMRLSNLYWAEKYYNWFDKLAVRMFEKIEAKLLRH